MRSVRPPDRPALIGLTPEDLIAKRVNMVFPPSASVAEDLEDTAESRRHQPEPGDIAYSTAPRLLTAADVIRGDAFKRPRKKYALGIPQMDTAMGGGVNSRQQSIVAAPTGVGKTGLTGTIVYGLAKNWQPVLWVCTELDAEEQAARFAAIAIREQIGGCITPDDLLRHSRTPNDAAEPIDGLPIYLLRLRRRDGDPFEAIREIITHIIERHEVAPVVVVDYLQKLAAVDADQRRLSVSHVSECLLDIAQDFDTHVMSISSVSRSFYNATARKLRKQNDEEDPRDWLAVGKESGDLEYDAAHLMFLDVGDEADMLGERPARLILAKARGGGEGFYGLRFHGASGHFRPEPNAATEMAPPTKVDMQELAVRKVVEYVRKHQFDAPSRREMRNHVDGAGTVIDAAVDIAVERGELTYADKTYVDGAGRTRTKKVLVPVPPKAVS